jgi:hypothetical protein
MLLGPGRWIPFVLLTLAVLFAATPVQAEEKVRVSVLSILASEKDDTVDCKLACIARQVRQKNDKLKGFRCVKMSCKSLVVGGTGQFDLGCQQTAAVTVEHGADEDNRVELKVTPPRMGEITYTTTCGKFFPIVTPVRTRNKDLLIIAVRVQPCHGNK